MPSTHPHGKLKTPTIPLLAGLLALTATGIWLSKKGQADRPAADAATAPTPGPTKKIDPAKLEAEDLLQLAEGFQSQQKRKGPTHKVHEVFQSGQSMLCDVFETENGAMALTFVTVKTVAPDGSDTTAAKSDAPLISIQQQTYTLEKAGKFGLLTTPTIIMKDGQQGEIYIGREDGNGLSLKAKAYHLSEKEIAVDLEFKHPS